MPEILRAVFYIRYSTEMQRGGLSIERQLAECRAFALKSGYKIVEGLPYIDEATSGQKVSRTYFDKIIEDAAKGLFDVVVVHSLTRASRFQELAYYYQFKLRLMQNNVKLVSCTEDIQNEEIGDVIEFLTLWQSKNEIKHTAENVRTALKVKAHRSEFNGGFAPLGYSIQNKKYVINELEAPAVRMIFDLYLKDHSYNDIIQAMNENYFRTRYGRPFGKNSLYEILHNKKYIGIYEWRKCVPDKNGKRNSHAPVNNANIVKGEITLPKIIDENVFYAVQEKLIKHKRVRHRNDFYLLSSVLSCGFCGGSMGGRTASIKNERYPYYCCNNKSRLITDCEMTMIPRDKLETAVLKYLNTFFQKSTADKIKKYYIAVNKDIKSLNQEKLTQIKKTKESIRLKINHCVEAIANGVNSPALQTKINDLESQYALAQLDENKYTIENAIGDSVSPDNILNELSKYKDVFHLSKEQQKELVIQYIRKITVTKEKNSSEVSFEIETKLDKFFPYAGADDSSRTYGKIIKELLYYKSII